MFNRDSALDLRACERIKFDQALYVLTMYEKKIRNKHQFKQGTPINSESMLEDIIYAWKKKWEADLTKPILHCATSVAPRVYINKKSDIQKIMKKIKSQSNKNIYQDMILSQSEESQEQFYQLIERFIGRMKIQHEDESNYKIVEKELTERGILQSKEIQNIQKSIGHIYLVIYQICQLYKENLDAQSIYLQDKVDINQDYLDHFTKVNKFCLKRFSRSESDQLQKLKQSNDDFTLPKTLKFQSLKKFVVNFVSMMTDIRDCQYGSSVFTYQPKLGLSLYLIHPVLVAIESFFLKQIQQRKKDKKTDQQQNTPKTLKMSQIQNASKVVFINLDGYESEFNLQFARNLKKNLLYISFPKEHTKEQDEIYSQRMYKKIMYKFTDKSSQLHTTTKEQSKSTQQMQDYYIYESPQQLRKQQICRDPQNYHYTINKFSNHNAQEDINQNMYVLPVRSLAFKNNHPDIFKSDKDIELYQSHFIRLVIRDFLVNQIRTFNPAMIIISYSGRLTLQDNHIVQICQQLTKVGSFKVVLFPNLTTCFAESDQKQINESQKKQQDLDEMMQEDQQNQYPNILKDDRISYKHLVSEISMSQNGSSYIANHPQASLYLLNFIARFMKVTSGTYNLTKNYQDQPIISKHKNQVVLLYTDEIMQALSCGREYLNIDRIRYKYQDLRILPSLYESKIDSLKKYTYQQNVAYIPKFYTRLYDTIEKLLFDPVKLSAQADPSLYKTQIQKIKADFKQRINENKSHEKNEGKDQKMKKNFKNYFMEHKTLHFIEISTEKYEEKAYLYIRDQTDILEEINKQQEKVDFRGLYEVKFLDSRKSTIPINKMSSILHRSDQNNLKKRADYFPVLFMNYLDEKNEKNNNQFTNLLFHVPFKTNINIEIPNVENCPSQGQVSIAKAQKRKKYGEFSNYIIYLDWSFTQTQEYLILFWPTQFDFIKAVISKILKKNYQPTILNDIYIAEKRKSKQKQFIKVQIYEQQPICPRIGASVLNDGNRLYIFGGFYQKDKNYLTLQADVTMMDITYVKENQKIGLFNLKDKLYGSQLNQKLVKSNSKVNSYIRPRLQCQFYHLHQLQPKNTNHSDNQPVIMFGGYGQNFIRPYSLITFYYYELNFKKQDTNNRILQSINRKIIYDNAIPINVKKMTKNSAIIRIPKRKGIQTDSKSSVPELDFTLPDSLALCRFRYQLDQDNSWKYDFKYRFSQDQFQTHRAKIKNLFEKKAEEFQNSEIKLKKIQEINNMIVLSKEEKKITVPLIYELPFDKTKQFSVQNIKIPAECIVSSIIVKENYLFCLIRHQVYTDDKYALLEFSYKDIEKANLNDIKSVNLKKLKQFQRQCFGLHVLFSMNQKFIMILHGQPLADLKIENQIFVSKKTKQQNIQKQVQITDLIQRQNDQGQVRPDICYSIFFIFSSSNVLWSYQFCGYNQSNIVYFFIQHISPENAKTSHWKTWGKQRLKLRFRANKVINLNKLKFLKCRATPRIDNKQSQFKSFSGDMISLEMEYKSQTYYCDFSLSQNHNTVIDIVLQTEHHKSSQEASSQNCMQIIHKTQQIYANLNINTQKQFKMVEK